VGIADSDSLAEAIIRLLGDPIQWKKAQTAGIRRVETYYTQDHMFDQYRAVYESTLQ
jgi:glycosyltransferase involved in cell wall biosynthesis